MKNLPEARVARLAECHKKQKAGYGQHASLNLNPPSRNHEIQTQYIIHLQKQAYAESTIRTKYKILRAMLNDDVNLGDPEAVKLYIARKQTWSNGHKILAVYTYNEYAKMKGIQWTIPQYKRNETLPFVQQKKK
jgi:hypothetical protein